MQIERTSKEIIIRIPANINTDDLQDFLDYARYKELTSKINVSQTKVDFLASKINKDWWSKNRNIYINKTL